EVLGRRLTVDLLDQGLADLEAEKVAAGVTRRALEQEARIGAPQLRLDLAIGRQRQRGAAPLEKRRAQGVDVMADAPAHAVPLPHSAVRCPAGGVGGPGTAGGVTVVLCGRGCRADPPRLRERLPASARRRSVTSAAPSWSSPRATSSATRATTPPPST